MSEPTSARWVRDAIELSNECEMWPDSRWSNGDILYWVDRATDAEKRIKTLEKMFAASDTMLGTTQAAYVRKSLQADVAEERVEKLEEVLKAAVAVTANMSNDTCWLELADAIDRATPTKEST